MSQNISHFSRGGQVWAHKVRMFAQVIKIATRMSLFMSGIVLLFRIINSVSASGLYMWFVYHWAEVKLSVASSLGYRGTVISFYDQGKWITLKAAYFVKHPHILSLIPKVESGVGELLSFSTLSHLLIIGALTYCCVFLYFYFQGKKVGSSKHKRGVVLANLKELKSTMKKRNLLGDFNLDGVPLVKGAETSHMLIAGTTGSGKTNTLNHLLPQIRDQKQKAIIVDVTGDLTAKYFDSSKDIILSPGHEQSAHWNPWLDATNTFEYRSMAEAFIGGSKSHDPFWTDAAKGCLSAAFEKLSSSQNIDELVQILLKSDLNQFTHFLKNTAAAPYADEKGERTTVSIRATLASKIQSLEIMPQAQGDFSIKGWIQSDHSGWLFLTTPPGKRDVLCPLITAELSITFQELMNQGADPTRRLWFVMDELPALNRIPSLPTMLAEGRKYGACVVAGLQDIPQLEVRYGHKEAQTLLNQLNTKVLFRFSDPQGAKLASQMLGEKEETEVKENLSYGANTIRDGVSMNEVTKKGSIVMPTEITSLKNLECFIKLPENLPLIKHQMTWKGL